VFEVPSSKSTVFVQSKRYRSSIPRVFCIVTVGLFGALHSVQSRQEYYIQMKNSNIRQRTQAGPSHVQSRRRRRSVLVLEYEKPGERGVHVSVKEGVVVSQHQPQLLVSVQVDDDGAGGGAPVWVTVCPHRRYHCSVLHNQNCSLSHQRTPITSLGYLYDGHNNTTIQLPFDRRSIPIRLQFDRATTIAGQKR